MTDDYKTVRRIIEDVETLVNDTIENYPILNGVVPELYYMNGNDGTDFDWKVNNHICELMVFYPSDIGAIKILITDTGKLLMWIYEDGEYMPKQEFTFNNRYTKDEAYKLAEFLMDNFDGNKVWDEPISVADLDASDYTNWYCTYWLRDYNEDEE